ncbi:MAG: glycosyltransferase family 4 protein [Verrucomicrobiota bacterium]|jgi:glycosyltransferase involved in cell wall biosynthesis
MRILYFSRHYTTHDRRFLEKLAESKHEVWFLPLEDDGLGYEQHSLPDRIHCVAWSGGKHTISTPESWWRLMPEFTAILDRLKPDLVQAGPVQSCGFMTAIAGAHPFLLMSWGYDILVDSDRDDLWRWMTRYALEHSDMLLCDCDAVRAKVQQILPYADSRVVQFPWGIDLQKFSPGRSSLPLRNRPGWEDAFIVLSTRSWEPIYGIDVLLKGFAAAYAEEHRLRLVLLGNGSLGPEIDHLIQLHCLKDAVLRPGRTSQADIPEYFRAADLYLSCAHSDGTSISLIEAMASGLPVVVTDGPGNREWVVSGENGWLAPDGESDAFARLMLAGASLDASKLQQIGRRNRQVAEKKANWDRNFSRLLQAYDQIRTVARL